VSLSHRAPDGEPRHTSQQTGVPQQRRAKISVAEALRAQFPFRSQVGSRPSPITIGEALRARFPQQRTSPENAPAEGAPSPVSAGRPSRPALPRRIRSIQASAWHAQPVNPALLRRVLDGLQRL